MKNRIVKGELRDWRRLKEEGKMSTRIKDNWRKKFRFSLALLLGAAAGCGPIVGEADSEEGLVVVTESGPVEGLECTSAWVGGCSGSGVEKFLGIPYAVPPVGALRWTPPQPRGRWAGVFKATAFGDVCTQPSPSGGTTGSEDCLSLNIFRPSQRNNESEAADEKHGENRGDNKNPRGRLPVMVWIHGGAFATGGSREYDPTPWVEKGVIVVTINYRLGFLGIFAQPALDAEGHLNANYWLMDQQLALKWVQRNIAAFGGDPELVTIVGQSAGGTSVYSNLASPGSAGLFHRAIAESGTMALFQKFDTMASLVSAENDVGIKVAANVGCGDQTAQCLRAAPAPALVAQQTPTLLPIVDGTVLPQSLNKAFDNGQFNRVPVISGSNHDEYRYMVATQSDFVGRPLTDDGYLAAVTALFPGPEEAQFVSSLVNDKYPLSKYPGPSGTQRAPLALGALGTDYLFACGARNAVLALSPYVPTFVYEFNDENSPFALALQRISFPWGAAHGFELAYLFNGRQPTPFTPAQKQLSDAMISYWTEFAKTGDPNSEGTPPWPLYNAGSHKFQSLIPPTPSVKSNFDADHQCSSIWNN